jgi:hypothetical protein
MSTSMRIAREMRAVRAYPGGAFDWALSAPVTLVPCLFFRQPPGGRRAMAGYV